MKLVVIIGNQAQSLINFRGPLIRCIVHSGCRVVAMAPDFNESTRDAVKSIGAEAVDFSMSRTGLTPINDLSTILGLYKILKLLRPDVVLAYAVKPVIYGTLAAAFAKVPVRVALVEGLGFVFTDNGATYRFKKKVLKLIVSTLYKLSLGKAERVLVLNPDDKQELIKSNLVKINQVCCIGGIGVDLKEWVKLPFPDLSVNELTFVMAARLLKEKGVVEYIQASRRVKVRYPNVRFLLLGGLDENPASISRDEITRLCEDGIVQWLGHVDMKKWLAASHVYVLPSYREGVPRSTQEAMAAGRAVITTDVPGCRETVLEGVNGFIIPPRDVYALEDAMLKFIRSPDLIFKMGNQSRLLAEDRFDVDVVNSKFMRILGLYDPQSIKLLGEAL